MPPIMTVPLRTIRLFPLGRLRPSSLWKSASRQLFFKFLVTNCALQRSLLDRRCCWQGDAHEPIFVRRSNRDRVVRERK